MGQRIIIGLFFCCIFFSGTSMKNHGTGSSSSESNQRSSLKQKIHESLGMPSVKIGFAKAPISNIGEKGTWTIHDDLYGGVLWIDDNRSQVALITLDYVEMTAKETSIVKKGITSVAGLPEDRLLISCSHTHSGMEFDSTHLRRLGILLGDLIKQAKGKAEPAQVAFCLINTARKFSINRRLKINDAFGTFTITYSRGTKVSVENGTVNARGQVEDFIRYGVNIYTPTYSARGVKQGKNSSTNSEKALREIPQELYLNGAADANLEVLVFRSLRGTSIGTLVRFACHPVIFNGSAIKQHSADYPGVLTREISKKTGSPTLFINGPCGDIKPVFTDYGEGETERFGRGLAKMVTDSIDQMKSKPLTAFTYNRKLLDFEVAPDMLRGQQVDFSEFDKLSAENFDPVVLKKKLDQSMRNWAIGYYRHKEPQLNLPFSLLGFNEIALVTLPGEIFNGHGFAIQKSFPGRPILIGELTDTDGPGYVPTRNSFADGGYEVSCATIVPGSGEKMVEIVKGMLNEFYKKN